MCVFPKVLIIIMFMGGAKLGLGGANPQKFFALRAKIEPRSARMHIDFISGPPPEQNPEYAPELSLDILLVQMETRETKRYHWVRGSE